MPPIRRTTGGRFRLLRMVPLLLLLAVAAATSHLLHRGSRSHAARPAGVQASFPTELVAATTSGTPAGPLVHVTVSPTATGTRLPASFLGLSIESWHLQQFDSDPLAFRRILSRLSVPGDGGLMLRVGGESTEQTYWDSPRLGQDVPAYRPGADWLDTLSGLTRADHLKLLLDLNLAADSPAMARRFASAVAATLPPGSVAGFEVGNEPDIGHKENPYPPGSPKPTTPAGWDHFTSAGYNSAFGSYATAVAKVAPKIPLAGPEVFFPGKDLDWLQSLAAAERPHLGMLTVHRYPLSSCANPAWHDYATVPKLLSPYASTGLANAMIPAVRVARQVHVPMRLSEVNSVTCGGSEGVSNSFATALWAADTLFSMWHVGVGGVNIHIQPQAPNAAFSVSPSGLTVHPLLYGMLMFTRALGPSAHLIGTRVSGARNTGVKVWAVRTRGGLLKLLLLDKAGTPARLALNLPSTAAATVQRLTAPSAAATRGVTLAGQTLGSQGQWLGTRTLQTVKRGSGGLYTVPVGAYSAVLVTVHT